MAVVLALGKGSLVVLLAWLLIGSESLMLAGYSWDRVVVQTGAGLAVVAGHIWPVYYKFRGGRGVATFFGGLLVISPPGFILGGGFLIIVVALTRLVSLGSVLAMVVIAATTGALYIFRGFPVAPFLYAITGGATIIIVHRDNIRRLWRRTERRLGEKAEAV